MLGLCMKKHSTPCLQQILPLNRLLGIYCFYCRFLFARSVLFYASNVESGLWIVIVYQRNDEYFYVLVMLAMACLVSAFVWQLWQVGVRTSQSPFGPLHPLWTGCIPVDLNIMCFTDNNLINLVFCSGIVNSDGSAFGFGSKICIYFFNLCLFVD